MNEVIPLYAKLAKTNFIQKILKILYNLSVANKLYIEKLYFKT